MKFTTAKKRAAHFLRTAGLAYNPINSTVVNALLELGYEVDLYAPGGLFPDVGPNPYNAKVRIFPVEYGKRWLLKNILLPHWREYSLFSGTTEKILWPPSGSFLGYTAGLRLLWLVRFSVGATQ